MQSRMARPLWVEAALRANPRDRFWQFYFRSHETKTGGVVRGLLPEQLVSQLEEYLERDRAVLLGALREPTDPSTLFFTRRGNPLCRNEVIRIVGAMTTKYGGRRVNPHLIRDIFAFRWLDDHPEDYLTLSKILWHRNIQTTIRIYGSAFDESQGARRVEEWLKQRRVSQ